jgi:hypothetical protein
MVLNSSEMTTNEEETRWIHSDTELISGHGVSYNVTVRTSFIFLLSIELFRF